MIYFSADHHFGHAKIIDYCHRPFDNVKNMDYELCRKWNDLINNDDIVYYLGDFAFHWDRYINKLKGTKIFLYGNHDKKISHCKELQINWGGYSFYMTHWPQDANKALPIINLVAHVHTKWKVLPIKNKYENLALHINVGVDVWDYKPVSITQIIQHIRELNKPKPNSKL